MKTAIIFLALSLSGLLGFFGIFYRGPESVTAKYRVDAEIEKVQNIERAQRQTLSEVLELENRIDITYMEAVEVSYISKNMLLSFR